MADRQIVWACGNCDELIVRESGESMGCECPYCGKEHQLYVYRDENIGSKARKKHGKIQPTDRKYKRSGESVNPNDTRGV